MSDLFCLLLLGTVLSTRRLILHAFEHTPLLNNVEEEFGNRSSFESQRVRVQANMADLNSILARGEKERPLRELCFSQEPLKSFACTCPYVRLLLRSSGREVLAHAASSVMILGINRLRSCLCHMCLNDLTRPSEASLELQNLE